MSIKSYKLFFLFIKDFSNITAVFPKISLYYYNNNVVAPWKTSANHISCFKNAVTIIYYINFVKKNLHFS